MPYYTIDTDGNDCDHDGSQCEAGATIMEFADHEAATAFFQSSYPATGPGDPEMIGWQEVSGFGDAWKMYDRKAFNAFFGEEYEDTGHVEINGIKCRVRAPGSHPGGREYWLDPVDTVYCPVVEIVPDPEDD